MQVELSVAEIELLIECIHCTEAEFHVYPEESVDTSTLADKLQALLLAAQPS